MTDTEKPPIISRETLIPVGVASACVLPIALGAIWIRDGVKDGQVAIQALRVEMNTRFNALEARATDSWRLSEMERWALLLERDNPTLKVPDVRK